MENLIIEYSSRHYPPNLRKIDKPPKRLYIQGNLEILENHGIAVVGSRTNTQYGEKMCKIFTKELVKYDFNIISGLAKGIDTIAHTTAIKNGGKTIAVLPCGIKNIYPKENISLAKSILENGGLLVSEYENNEKADSNKFRERNRIVAGLGIGTLVIEAGEKSGTNITARNTISQQKTLFAIPSSLENKKGITSNNLIKKGANLVTKIEDILNKYPEINFKVKDIEEKDIYIDIPKDLIEIYKTINDEPKTIDEIIIKTGLPVNEVNSKITLLEIEEKIIQLSNGKYVRKNDE